LSVWSFLHKIGTLSKLCAMNRSVKVLLL
jgi:hypothetical protein